MWKLKRLVAAALIAALGASSASFAQSCALCYNSAAALKTAAKHALNAGIMVLLIPVLLMFGAIFVLAFRSLTRSDEAGSVPAADWETKVLQGCVPGLPLRPEGRRQPG